MAKKILSMIGKKKKSESNLILNTSVSKKIDKLFWGEFSKLCLGKKLNSFVFYQYGCGEFLLCGYVSRFSEVFLPIVVQMHVNF